MLVLLPLVAWRVYSRFRRMVGRQRLSKVRPWVTLTLFPALLALLSFAVHRHPEQLLWLVLGLGLGSLLGVFGLSKTHFEPTPAGLFYTPNAHLGIALSLLFVVRIGYRLIELYTATNKPDEVKKWRAERAKYLSLSKMSSTRVFSMFSEVAQDRSPSVRLSSKAIPASRLHADWLARTRLWALRY